MNVYDRAANESQIREFSRIRYLWNYVEVLKPLPSLLLAFIGAGAAIIAGDGVISPRLLLITATIFIAAGAANGLTNYLDRELDARMARTRNRVLPSRRIYPAQKVLPWLISLIIAGLALALYLHPFALFADLFGTLTAATWRKKVTCVYPQGVIASCAPVLIGWFAVRPVFNPEILLLCALIAVWLPLHVWSVVIAHQEDYRQAGLNYFPINYPVKKSVRVLMVFSLVLFVISLSLFYTGSFGWLYLVAAVLLGISLVFACLRLVTTGAAKDAWKLYKLSTFPYLGIIFLVMCLDIWL
ncbi:MAG: protoheme IX farnesyltransferase [Dehalococcoidales bacterium]|nr:protoheme IX farnesyltransferase [Dehalococcoidales bacterium]